MKKAMEAAKTEEWETLAASMRKTLADNLQVALEVAGEKDGYYAKKMNLADLSRKTKIARSTLSKLKREKTSNGIQSNPDLKTICRLAAALNLPPAFLLMSATDWKRFLGTLDGLREALSGPYLDKSILKAAGSDTVSVGVNLVKQIGLYSDDTSLALSAEEASARQQEIDQEIDLANSMKLLAILTTTAVTQTHAKNYNDLATLIAIGAIFGASFKRL